MIEPVAIKIKLNTLTRHRKVEKWGKAEPYLWTIFFKIDGASLTITPQFRLEGNGVFHFTPGSHGNLGISEFSSSTPVPIPPEIGEWKTDLYPFKVPYFEQHVPSIVGVICILMEQNNVSFKGAEAGHEALNELVEQAVNQALKEFDPRIIDIQDVMNSIRQFFEKKVEELTQGVDQVIIDAIKKKQNLWHNILSLINSDNLIGYHVWNFNQQEIIDAGTIGTTFNHHWVSDEHGDYEVEGDISIINNPPFKVATQSVEATQNQPERAPTPIFGESISPPKRSSTPNPSREESSTIEE